MEGVSALSKPPQSLCDPSFPPSLSCRRLSMPSPVARSAHVPYTSSTSWTPVAPEKIRPLPPVVSSSKSRMPYATSPIGHSIPTQVNRVGGGEGTRPPIPAIVVRLATEDGSVDLAHVSQTNYSAQKRKGNRKSFVVSAPSAALAEGVFSTRLCNSPETASRAESLAGSLPPVGKGKGGAEASKHKEPSSGRMESLPYRGGARSGAKTESRAQDDVQSHTPLASPCGGTDTPCHTQSPASVRTRLQSPSMENVAMHAVDQHAPKGDLPARVAALCVPLSKTPPQAASSQKDRRNPRSAEENSRPGRPLTPLHPPVERPGFLAVPLQSPAGSRKTARSISPRRRKAYPPSLESRNATESDASSFWSPFSRSARHTSTSRTSAGSPSVYGPSPDWIQGPSLFLQPPCRAFAKASAPHIESHTLRRKVCKSTARTDPSLVTARQVNDEKQRLSFSSPTEDEKRRGRAGGKVDPLNGHYVYAYDPESPPRHSRAVRDLGVPEPLGSGDASAEWEDVDSSFAQTERPASPMFPPLSRNSPQYAEVQRRRSFDFLFRGKAKQRLQVDTNDSSWPLVDLQHWDMAKVSVMTQEDQRMREQRIENHPSTKVETLQHVEEAGSTTTEEAIRRRRLFVANPDERDDLIETTLTTSHDDTPTHEPASIDTRHRTQGDQQCNAPTIQLHPERRQASNSTTRHEPTSSRQKRTTKREVTPRHGSWIDEMTMRGLFKLLEQTLKASQKVRVAAECKASY